MYPIDKLRGALSTAAGWFTKDGLLRKSRRKDPGRIVAHFWNCIEKHWALPTALGTETPELSPDLNPKFPIALLLPASPLTLAERHFQNFQSENA